MDKQTGDYLIRGINDVTAERMRQIEQENFSAEHDDDHEGGTLAAAGACYAMHSAFKLSNRGVAGEPIEGVPVWWPWDPSWWKPEDVRGSLVKAAALIIAEIDRYDRKHG